MKLRLLISTGDKDYAERLAGVLTERHAESFDVTVCTTAERLASLQSARAFDVALTDARLLRSLDASKVKLPLLLWSELHDADADADGWSSGEAAGANAGSGASPGASSSASSGSANAGSGNANAGSDSSPGPFAGADTSKIGRLRKYRRVSAISSDIMEAFAKSGVGEQGVGEQGVGEQGGARVTAVWSPAGGVGKTSVALAYAARLAASGAGVAYLDLEHFSSVPSYFAESGKSISSAFGHLDRNVSLLLKAIELKDSGSGITYFTRPDNYDDMNELTAQDVGKLIKALSGNAEELVIDLPCACDERVKLALERADEVIVVTDPGKTAGIKLLQFQTQHNLFERIRDKAALAANKGARPDGSRFSRVISLPAVSTSDPITVYKTLSGMEF